MNTSTGFRSVALATLFLSSALGCAASPPCRRDAADDVTVAGRTTGKSLKTAAETSRKGIETHDEWEEGKAETKATAHSDAAKVRRAGGPRGRRHFGRVDRTAAPG